MSRTKLAGVLAAGALVLCACSGTGQDSTGGDSGGADMTVAVVTHGAPEDSFWSVVQSGAEQAGTDLGVTVNYSSDPDPSGQSELIDNAVAQKVDGIVVSMANPEGVKDSVEAAVAAGIPVVTINSGLEESKAYGAITHIGQSESLAGQAAGTKFNDLGATKLICVIHEAGNIGLTQRCDGAAETFDGDVETLQVNGTGAEAGTTIATKLQSDPSIDGLLALNGDVALRAQQSITEQGSEVTVGTFDLSPDVIAAIQDGGIAFAIDQQPYVQGYLGVTFLYLKATNGNDVGGGQPVYSGPALVTKDNADQVAAFAENGTR